MTVYEKIIEFVDTGSEKTVAIVGSSTGAMPLFVAPLVGRVVGVDLSEQSIAFAERRTGQLGVTNIEYTKGDAESLPFDADSVDIVLTDCVINLTPQKQTAIDEIFKILKPGGCLVMADPVRKGEIENLAANEPVAGCIAGTVTLEDYSRMLKRSGFENLKTTDVTGLARNVWPDHREKFDKYGLDYLIIKAIKPSNS